MANNFKNDDSFLRKLAVGAAGTNETMSRLAELGFNPIELERGSTGFKIWKKIKIKRVRVPDILCLNTGLRFESRGKTKLEISMSHSKNDPKRTWDAGMRDDDIVSIVQFAQSDYSPIDIKRISPIHFIKVSDLREAFDKNQVSITQPKGVEEGSEIRVVWISAVANQDSIVEEVDSNKITLKPHTGARRQRVRLDRQNGRIKLIPQVQPGNEVCSNQIVASVVPLLTKLTCPKPVLEDYFIEKLGSMNLSERYAAAKALRYKGYQKAETNLRERLNDKEEDIYVQLEAAAALAAYDDEKAWDFIEGKLRKSALEIPLETQLETIIVASEIDKKRSEQLLIHVLQDSSRDEELRAGAAWALGQFVTKTSAAALVDTFNNTPVDIKIEAARALMRIANPQVDYLTNLLKISLPEKRDGISWVLARTGNFNPADIALNADENLRQWLSYIVGYGKDKFSTQDIAELCKKDGGVYFAASVLWQIVSSWIHELKEY